MKNTKRNWKTSIFGALMLAMAGFSIYTDPAKATDPGVMGAVAGALGLLLAKDGDKTGTAQQPHASQAAPAPEPEK
jgi:hypothetical protein